LKPATIVGWTGNGELGDLERTVAAKLAVKRSEVVAGTRSLVVKDVDPIAAARRLAHLPGVSWIAVGYEFGDFEGCMENVATLASRYLAKGASFSVSAHVERSRRTDGDVILEANSRILCAVKGITISERNPKFRFRVLMVGDSGACGVELKEGAGGVPTSVEPRVYCLVSGGYHSAVMAWMASLSGFSVTLVHARAGDEPLRQVARLYSELSYRTDPATLELLVLKGNGDAGDRLRAWLDRSKGKVLAGSHPECRGHGALRTFGEMPPVLIPLLLVQESEVKAKLRDLGLKEKSEDGAMALKASSKRGKYTTKSYGGKEADHNTVLDSILS
jgi:hypothetical protein